MTRCYWPALGLILVASSCRDSTGLHIFAHVAGLQFDELRIGVDRTEDETGAKETLVAPEVNGRYVGPFGQGDQDLYVYLPDGLDGARLHCWATALRASAIVASGSADTTVRRDTITDVQISITTGPGSSVGGSSGSGGMPGAAGTGGTSGGAAGSGAHAVGGSSGSGDGGGSGLGTGGAAGSGSGGRAGSGSGGAGPGSGGRSGSGTGGSGPGAGGSGMGGARSGAGGSGTGGSGTGGAGVGGAPGIPKLANGHACSSATECVSSHCVDGVCCESDCSGACTSCSLPATAGLCRPVLVGTQDPRGICADMGAASCGTSGLCDVSGHCANYPAGTTCIVPTCKNGGMLAPAAACDGAGKCLEGPAIKCPVACAAGVCL